MNPLRHQTSEDRHVLILANLKQFALRLLDHAFNDSHLVSARQLNLKPIAGQFTKYGEDRLLSPIARRLVGATELRILSSHLTVFHRLIDRLTTIDREIPVPS